ncbi:MAG: hypothetical protein J6J42_06580 [Lachnospiraceae bacterium]|nr:hypothetical protein [Lachnospiraceae bacterium]
MKEKKSSLHFAGRTHSRKGMMSTVIAGFAWIIFIALCVYSTIQEGKAELVAGAIGIFDAFFALTGAILAMKGFQEREVYYVLPTVGILLNGFLFVIYFALYFMGVAIV